MKEIVVICWFYVKKCIFEYMTNKIFQLPAPLETAGLLVAPVRWVCWNRPYVLRKLPVSICCGFVHNLFNFYNKSTKNRQISAIFLTVRKLQALASQTVQVLINFVLALYRRDYGKLLGWWLGRI